MRFTPKPPYVSTRHDLKREMVAVKWNGIEEAASYLRRKEEAI